MLIDLEKVKLITVTDEGTTEIILDGLSNSIFVEGRFGIRAEVQDGKKYLVLEC